jgi:flagellar FliL protein
MSRKRLIIIAAIVLVLAGGAGYWFVLKPGPSVAQPGAVDPLNAIQVNLADGHYLRVGLALQLTKDAQDIDGSKALDAAIGLFSGVSVSQADDAASREKLRAKLVRTLASRYDGKVMNVYFTEFVTQ